MRKLFWILWFKPTAKALMLMKFTQWMVWLQFMQCKHSLSDLLRVELSLHMYIVTGGCYSNTEKLKAEHKVE